MNRKKLLLALAGLAVLVLAIGVTAGMRRQASDDPASPRACWLRGASDAQPAVTDQCRCTPCECDNCRCGKAKSACTCDPCTCDDCQCGRKGCADGCDRSACDKSAKPCTVGGNNACGV